jgi:beta-aspartyl-peptidase (threonine type)
MQGAVARPVRSTDRRAPAGDRRAPAGALAGVAVVVLGGLVACAPASREEAEGPASGFGDRQPATAGPGEALVSAGVRQVLDAQVAAWNQGDLDGFLVGYWNSPELVFTSGGQVQRGYATLRHRYRVSYWSGGDPGRLSFEDLEVHALAPDAAWAMGGWRLALPSDTLGGVFTLVLRKFDDGWKIVHDHTSAGPGPVVEEAASP